MKYLQILLLSITSIAQVSSFTCSSISKTSLTSLNAVSSFQSLLGGKEETSNDDNNSEVIPFVIDELTQLKASKECGEIADLVIKVFFEEEAELSDDKKSKGGMT